MFRGLFQSLANRSLRRVIEQATRTLYSEDFDFDALINRLSGNGDEIACLRAYAAVETAARLTEPLSEVQVNWAVERIRAAETRVNASNFSELVQVHRDLAGHFWDRRKLSILDSKLAYKNNGYSLKGGLYRHAREAKGPVSKEVRLRLESLCGEIANLDGEIEDAELAAWKKQDLGEYHRYKHEVENRDAAATRRDADMESLQGDADDIEAMLGARCLRLLEGKSEAERQQEFLSELDRSYDAETLCSMGDAASERPDCDDSMVVLYYRIAAKKGSARAAHNLGVIYEEGIAVPKDTSEAVMWYTMAADGGYAGSQNNLGRMYETGEGVTADLVRALSLYELASAGGDANGASNAKRMRLQQKLEACRNLVDQTGDFLEAHSYLLADAAGLPAPKAEILYAVQFIRACLSDDVDAKKTIDYLLLLQDIVASQWWNIDACDRRDVEILKSFGEWPEWAAHLRQKYIKRELAAEAASDASHRATVDYVALTS